MRRIAMWLDGTKDAASMLTDVQRLLAPDGELILILDPEAATDELPIPTPGDRTPGLDLHTRLMVLENEGVPAHILERPDVLAHGLDLVLRECGADMLACSAGEADHVGASAWKGTIGRALAHSAVPILVCPSKGTRRSSDAQPRLLVPLDGSAFAESVLPLAENLAREWNAPLWLTQVITVTSPWQDVSKSREYLLARGKELDCKTQVHVSTGRSAPTMLVQAVRDWMITDLVMASHGWTGSADAVVGSVTERVIEHLPCRLIVVSATALPSVSQSSTGTTVSAPLPS